MNKATNFFEEDKIPLHFSDAFFEDLFDDILWHYTLVHKIFIKNLNRFHWVIDTTQWKESTNKIIKGNIMIYGNWITETSSVLKINHAGINNIQEICVCKISNVLSLYKTTTGV